MTNHMNTKTFLVIMLIVINTLAAFCQPELGADEAVQIALKNNLMIKSGEYHVAYQKQLKRSSFDLGKTHINWMHGQFNSILNDNNYTISQSIPFPTALANQVKLSAAEMEGAELELTMTKNELVRQVRSTYHQLAYLIARNVELSIQDSVYFKFAHASQLRLKAGEGTLLEKTTAETQWMEIKNQLMQNESDISIYKRQLQTLLNSAEEIPSITNLGKIALSPPAPVDLNPHLQQIRQEVTIADRTKRLERSKILPDITLGYFTQSLIGFQRVDNNDVFFGKNDRFTGFELGLSFPLWFVPQQSRSRAAALNQAAAEKRYEYYSTKMEGELQSAQLQIAKSENSLTYYETTANVNTDLILLQAQRSFEEGEIGYLEFLQAINQARAIRLNYLDLLNGYNQAVIQLDYITGKF